MLVDDGPAPVERGRLAESLRPMPQSSGVSAATTGGHAAKAAQHPRRPVRTAPRDGGGTRGRDMAPPHSQAVGDQASRLGQTIIQDDQQFDQQLKAKFDRTVGTLTGSGVAEAERATAAANEAARPASQIATLLASPDGVQQAIIVNEILRRPSDRW